MNHKILLLSTLLVSGLSFSQVGISTEDPKATLDIKQNATFAYKGLLIPRLTSAEVLAMPVTADQNSMMIYLNAAVPVASRTGRYINMSIPAHYYYDSAKNIWVRFLDTDTSGRPTGFERLPDMTATTFSWRLIGADPTKYNTILGKYAVDASWNPASLAETIGGLPYSYVLGEMKNEAGVNLTTANLGALGQNSFAAGTINSASGPASTALGAGNQSSGVGSFSAGVLNKSFGTYAASLGLGNTSSKIASFAVGNNNQATGDAAIALGTENIASGHSSAAIGQKNEATKQGTFALGNTNKATDVSAIAIGQTNQANGQASLAMGTSNIVDAAARNAIVIGQENNILGIESVTLGNTNSVAATAQKGFAIGYGLNTTTPNSTSMGTFNTVETAAATDKRLFVIGKGTGAGSRADALTILKSGKVGIDTNFFENTTSDAKLQVNGNTKTQGLVANFKFGNTILANDYTVVLSGDVTLPASTAANQGRILNLCSDGNIRTISGSMIDSGGNALTATLNGTAGGRCFTLQSVGDGRWWIIGRN